MFESGQKRICEQDAYRWYAAYVKSRHEFVAENELKMRGVEVYMPTLKRLSNWKDRKKWLNIPLFPGYLFVHIPSDSLNFNSVLRSRGVVYLLGTDGAQPEPVPLGEINSLKQLIAGGKELSVGPTLRAGQKVRITGGPLKDVEGYLEKRENGKHYLLVNIHILGRTVRVGVYPEFIDIL